MTISDKLTYLNDTKTQLKDMINYGLDTGEKITSETTFRNYVKSLFDAFIKTMTYPDVLYNNLPKVTGEGASLTLNDTVYAPMRVELSPSALEQETTTGKNLLPTNSFTLVKGSSRTLQINFPTPIPAGTYTLSCKITNKSGLTSTNGMAWELYDSSTTPATRMATFTPIIDSTSSPYSSTKTTDGQFTRLYIYLQNVLENTATITLDEVMLEQSSSATSYEPYTNGASPNPQYPQEIHTVSGENTVVVGNKNLLNRNTCSENKSLIWTNGTENTETGSLSSDYIRVNIGDKIICSYQCQKMFYDKNKNYLGALQNNGTTIAKSGGSARTDFTVPNYSDIYYVRLGFRASYSSGTDLLTANIMVNKGTTLLDYVPHQEQTYPLSLGDLEYCKIGDYEDLFMKPSGKNLFDKDSATTEVGYFKSDGTIVSGGSSTITTSYTKIVPNTDMVFSGITPEYVCFYDENKNFIERVSGITTFNKNAYYIRFQETTSSLNLDNIQLEVGTTTPTPYEPYGSGEWYLKKNIGKVVLDGSENWFDDGGGAPFALRNTNVARNNRKVMVISDYFRGVSYNSSWSAYDYLVSTSSATASTGYLKFKYLGITALADFKTWLSEHNPIVYYALATPTYTLLSDTLQTQLDNIQKAISYQDQTNVSQTNNDLPFVIKLSAIEDLSGIFELIQG